MRKLIHFCAGWVAIQVTGTFPERFLNLCGAMGIGFWCVEQGEKGSLRLHISLLSLKRAEEAARRAHCTLEVLRRCGLPALAMRGKKRYAFWTGMALSILCAMVLSHFILIVNVEGNHALTDSVILTELESLGFGVGSYGPAVDERALSNQVLLALPRLSYLNINISGVYAQVEVRERQSVPPIENPTQPSDIVAAADGVVLDVDLLAGQAQVQEGEAVLAGEVLISGENTYERGDGTGAVVSRRTERAAGKVWAMTRRTLCACTPMQVASKQSDGREKRAYTLRILKYPIKICRNSSISPAGCDTIKTLSIPALPGGVTLPAAVEKTTFAFYETHPAQVAAQAAHDLLEQQLRARLERLLGEEGSVLSERWTEQEKDGVLTLTLTADCTEQIGTERFAQQESTAYRVTDDNDP